MHGSIRFRDENQFSLTNLFVCVSDSCRKKVHHFLNYSKLLVVIVDENMHNYGILSSTVL